MISGGFNFGTVVDCLVLRRFQGIKTALGVSARQIVRDVVGQCAACVTSKELRKACHRHRQRPRPHYPIGAETCSCTITHLPFSFSQITVQRKFPSSTFPAFAVISSLTVAGAHYRAPWWVLGTSPFAV